MENIYEFSVELAKSAFRNKLKNLEANHSMYKRYVENNNFISYYDKITILQWLDYYYFNCKEIYPRGEKALDFFCNKLKDGKKPNFVDAFRVFQIFFL